MSKGGDYMLYTTNEIATILKIHVDTVRKKIRTGDIKATKVGRDYRITEEELNRLVKGGF